MGTMIRIFAAAACAACVASAASAVTYATDVVYKNQTLTGAGNPVAAGRSDETSVFGAADGDFYSLGIGGELVLKFDSLAFEGPGAVVEVTYGNTNNWDEYVDVFFATSAQYDEGNASDLSGFALLGNTGTNNPIHNGNAQAGADLGVPAGDDWVYILFRDSTAAHSNDQRALNGDGFDIDSVWVTVDPTREIAPVPLPAGIWMMGVAFAGLGAAARRKARA